MKLRELFYDQYQYSPDSLKPWVIMVPLLLLIIGACTALVIFDDQHRQDRYEQCMQDKRDHYFCDIWARGRGAGK